MWDLIDELVRDGSGSLFALPFQPERLDAVGRFPEALHRVSVLVEVVFGRAHRPHLEREAALPRGDQLVQVVAELHDATGLAFDRVEVAASAVSAAPDGIEKWLRVIRGE